MESHSTPGFGHALTLLSRRLGLDIAVFKACGYPSFEVGPPGSGPPQPSATTSAVPQDRRNQERAACEFLDAMASTQEQFRRPDPPID